MSFTGVFGLVLLVIVAIALLGPRKLPQGIEQLWLMLTNLRHTKAELPPLTLEQARRSWQRSGSILYDVIQILYGAVEHLVELRRGIFVVLGTLAGRRHPCRHLLQPILKLLTRAVRRRAAPVPQAHRHDLDLFRGHPQRGRGGHRAGAAHSRSCCSSARPWRRRAKSRSTGRVAIVGMPLVVVFFAAGMAFAYFILLPLMLQFLGSTGSDIATANWNIREYFSFVLAVMLWIGAAFETPVDHGAAGAPGHRLAEGDGASSGATPSSASRSSLPPSPPPWIR